LKFVTCTHIGKREDFAAGHMTQIMLERGCQVNFIDPNQLLANFDAGRAGHGSNQIV